MRRSAWVKNICWNLNLLCRQKSMETVEKIYHNIQKYTGSDTPEKGMSKAFFCLAKAKSRKENKHWTGSALAKKMPKHALNKDYVKSENDRNITPGRVETAKRDPKQEIVVASSQKKRRKSEAAASSSAQIVHPWREGLAEDRR